jgi:hypothetical protein
MAQHETLHAMKTPSIIRYLMIAVASAAALHTQAADDTTAQVTAPTRYGKGLGRLLTTEAERTKIDDARFNVAPPPKPVQDAGPAQLQIEGISLRPEQPAGRRVTIWIDGSPHLESDLPKGLSLVRNSSGEITGIRSQVSKGKSEFAKIGDMISRPQTDEEAKAQELAAKRAKDKP